MDENERKLQNEYQMWIADRHKLWKIDNVPILSIQNRDFYKLYFTYRNARGDIHYGCEM